MKLLFISLVLWLATCAYASNTGRIPFPQIAELTPSDGSANDGFGVTIAVSGDTIAVGAWTANGDEGAIYIFVKPAGGWGDMTQTAKLTVSNATYGTFLGSSIAMTSDTIVSGGPSPSSSRVYVFSKPPTGWTDMTETAVLTDGIYGDTFGGSVAAVNNLIVVGAQASFDQKGAAYIFLKPSGGWQTTSSYAAQLTASDGQPQDLFGVGLGTNGQVIVVGAPYATVGSNKGQGKGYVFSRPPSGWATTSNYTAELTASDGAANNYLGGPTSMSGKTIAFGVPFASPQKQDQGAAYVFVEPAGGWTTGTETAELTAPDGAGSELGTTVTTSGNLIVAGANVAFFGQGAAYLYSEPSGGWKSTSRPNAHATASDGGPKYYFGTSSGMGGGVIVVGAPYTVIGGYNIGSVYVFKP